MRQKTGPFVQPECQFKGEGGGGEDGRPPGATFVCPEHQAPSGHSAERTASVTSLLLENRVATDFLRLALVNLSLCHVATLLCVLINIMNTIDFT